MGSKALISFLVAAMSTTASACGIGPPSTAECIALWNDAGNQGSRDEVARMGLPHAHVAGWPSKAGDHCSVTFFTRPAEPWVTFVLWLDAPEPTDQFSLNVEGARYGRGELGAETVIPPNAEVNEYGTLSVWQLKQKTLRPRKRRDDRPWPGEHPPSVLRGSLPIRPLEPFSLAWASAVVVAGIRSREPGSRLDWICLVDGYRPHRLWAAHGLYVRRHPRDKKVGLPSSELTGRPIPSR